MGAQRLLDFVQGMTRLVEAGASEEEIMEKGLPMLAGLVRNDDWLAEPFTRIARRPYEFAGVEINPLIVLPRGQGVIAVDALISPLS